MKFDTKQEGLLTVFKPYQAVLMEHIWNLNKNEKVGITSGEAHQFLSGKPEKKSRAQVINFLNDMVEEGVVGYERARRPLSEGARDRRPIARDIPRFYAQNGLIYLSQSRARSFEYWKKNVSCYKPMRTSFVIST